MITLESVNNMSASQFIETFGDIAEHSPWVAERAKKKFDSCSAMIARFCDVVVAAGKEEQLSLLCAHPDLATKAKLTEDSTQEQKGAGLDSLSVVEFADFNKLNNQYKEQNGFPFIFAVKGATKHQILESFKVRIHASREDEFKMALHQVCKIIGFRLEARVSD